ncbi:protoporphyrinogen oxidase [Gordonia sp. TBRC 11910]|uniref:Protoporphyrinogen oxidase n=1 Tax=Gordonia asplenii TaxID=2725283 RepID=A0A848KT21_9ACTN|nr:flavodoxin domain-containing protein [Gordonia asplenii]NMO01600.1 protoporphyrinogen oxidase [Gordonia asplenii]
MIRVLVSTASRHGATTQIGEQLGSALRKALDGRGLDADVDIRGAESIGAGTDVGRYDAAVIGSAVYFGRWLRPARRLIAQHDADLKSMPVWLFSSGPIGEEGSTVGPPPAPDWVREHKTFGGKVDPQALRWHERLIVKVLRVADTDSRDAAAITRWADQIAAQLVDAVPQPLSDHSVQDL